MHIVWMLVVGLIAGALAKLLMPGKQGGGIGVTVLLGLVGALLAGLVGRAMGLHSHGQVPGILASTLGAFVVLLAYGLITRSRALRHP